MSGTIDQMKAAGLKVVDVAYERTASLHEVDIRLRIAFMNKPAFYDFESHLMKDGVHEILAVKE